MSDYRPLTASERRALQKRTARAVRQLWAFQGFPVQVGAPCPGCGGLYWYVFGHEPIAPSGYCLNCRPEKIAHRPALLKLVRESMLDETGDATPDAPPPGQLHLF